MFKIFGMFVTKQKTHLQKPPNTCYTSALHKQADICIWQACWQYLNGFKGLLLTPLVKNYNCSKIRWHCRLQKLIGAQSFRCYKVFWGLWPASCTELSSWEVSAKTDERFRKEFPNMRQHTRIVLFSYHFAIFETGSSSYRFFPINAKYFWKGETNLIQREVMYLHLT